MEPKSDGSRTTRMLVIAACFVIVVAGMKAAASILVPCLLAVFIVVIIAPLFLWLKGRGVPDGVAILLMALVLAGAGFLGVGILRTSVRGFSDNLATYQESLSAKTGDLWNRAVEQGILSAEETPTKAVKPEMAMRYLGAVTGTLRNVLTQAFLILLVVIFILLEVSALPDKMRALPGMSEARWGRLHEVVYKIRRYISLKTVMCALTGVLVSLFTAVLGVDYPILMGLLAFALNYVPNIGSIIAAVPAVLLAFIEFGLGSAAITAIGYVAINMTVSNLIEPRFVGRGLGLSPLVILISLIFWGWVLGPVGMLLSVPLTMAVKIALEDGEETRWIALMMGSAASGQVASPADQEAPDRDSGEEGGDASA